VTGAVAVVLMRSGEWHATSLLAKGGAHGASDYISDTDATSDINNFFDKELTLKQQVEQKLRALPAKAAPAKAEKSEVKKLRSQFAEIMRMPGKAAPARKQVATGKLAAVDRALEKEEQKVEELKKQRAILESNGGKAKVMQQQLRWRTYPPGGGATSYAKSMTDGESQGTKVCAMFVLLHLGTFAHNRPCVSVSLCVRIAWRNSHSHAVIVLFCSLLGFSTARPTNPPQPHPTPTPTPIPFLLSTPPPHPCPHRARYACLCVCVYE
jgi:hypothetical protein